MIDAADETIHGVAAMLDPLTACGIAVDALRYGVAQMRAGGTDVECEACRAALRLQSRQKRRVAIIPNQSINQPSKETEP